MSTTVRLKLPDIERRICDIASKTLSISRDEVLPSSRLIEDLRCDSLDAIELFISAEEAFSVALPVDPPNSIYKAVFTRRPFRLSDFSEMIYLQQGTGTPKPHTRRRSIPQPAQVVSVPFTQLSGKWEPERLPKMQLLYEPLCLYSQPNLYRRRSDGMRCMLVPVAEVEIGSCDPEALPDERPMHRVELDSFLIDAEPVSTTAYCRFLNSVEAVPQYWTDWFLLDPMDDRQLQMPIERVNQEWQPVGGTEHFPMVLVSWYGANAYSLWANGGRWTEYRSQEGLLPTEAQWEYAARGTRSRPFPCAEAGESQDVMKSAQHERGVKYRADTLPLSEVHERLGMSPFGLHHMAGNVWQWCRDWYDAGFYGSPESTSRNPINLSETGIRSERGGSWVGPDYLCRSSYRRGRSPDARGRCLGFRCVASTDFISIPE